MQKHVASKAQEHRSRQPRWPEPLGCHGRPLEGVKVLDVTRILAGPFCAMQLADLGATVIKIESPNGDDTRRWGPPFYKGTAAYYYGSNRNKHSVVLDLSATKDRQMLTALMAEADVVLQNFTERTARKLGVDFDTAAATNPDIIHLTLSGFGDQAPERTGYDLTVQALAGLMAITGEQHGSPMKMGVPISDLSAGLYATIAVMSALISRDDPPRATRLEVSLVDSALALLPNQSMSWLLCGADTPRLGTEHPVVVPYGAYATANGSLVIAIGNDASFVQLCALIGAPQLAQDPRFRTNSDRVANRGQVRTYLEELLRARTSEEWSALLDAARIPNAVVRSVPEALSAHECRSVAVVADEEGEEIPQVMGPIRINGEYLRPYLPPPALGRHTATVLGSKAHRLAR